MKREIYPLAFVNKCNTLDFKYKKKTKTRGDSPPLIYKCMKFCGPGGTQIQSSSGGRQKSGGNVKNSRIFRLLSPKISVLFRRINTQIVPGLYLLQEKMKGSPQLCP